MVKKTLNYVGELCLGCHSFTKLHFRYQPRNSKWVLIECISFCGQQQGEKSWDPFGFEWHHENHLSCCHVYNHGGILLVSETFGAHC